MNCLTRDLIKRTSLVPQSINSILFNIQQSSGTWIVGHVLHPLVDLSKHSDDVQTTFASYSEPALQDCVIFIWMGLMFITWSFGPFALLCISLRPSVLNDQSVERMPGENYLYNYLVVSQPGEKYLDGVVVDGLLIFIVIWITVFNLSTMATFAGASHLGRKCL